MLHDRKANAAMKRRQLRYSLATITAMLVVLMAVLAGGSLWILHRLHNQAAHKEAARQVLADGETIVRHLGDQAVRLDPDASGESWSSFSRQVRALHAVQEELQYVSVTLNGFTIFYEQTQGLAPIEPDRSPAEDAGIDMKRQVIDLAGESVPVVVFTRRMLTEDGALCEVEIAVRKESVAREERAATTAIGSMFKLSLVTVTVSFGACALLVVWVMRRETEREKQRREEEHLAFAGVLANGIVHDFRNPMSSVRLDVQMMAKELQRGADCRHERMSQLAGRVQETVDRMDKVFQEFLYMSKPPSDERESIDLGGGIRECVSMLGARFEQAGVAVDLHLPTQPMLVLAYPSALQRALMNVVINAEQASPAGGVVRIRLVKRERTATIDVIDAGPGVQPRDRARIFDMFVTTRPGGTGLGLFLAKTAIERCGGRIHVLEAAGGGACFRIDLPLAGRE